MRFGTFLLFLFIHTSCSAQLMGECEYPFNEDVDSLLTQLRKGDFNHLHSKIKENVCGEKHLVYDYYRINDSILYLQSPDINACFLFDSPNRRYDQLDDQFCLPVYAVPTSKIETKDSSGFSVGKWKDKEWDYYWRSLYDSKGRSVYRYEVDLIKKKVKELKWRYNGDTTVFMQYSILSEGFKVLLQSDSTITGISFINGRKKAYSDSYFEENNINNSGFQSGHEHEEKIYSFDSKKRISKVMYKRFDGTFKEKMQITFLYD